MMGQHTQTDRKWNLDLLFCLGLLIITSCAASIYEASSLLKNKTYSVVKPSPAEATESTKSLSSFHLLPHPPLVHQRFQSDESHSLSDMGALPDVSLTCGRSDFVVRVKPAFYGLGADASDLRLGRTCQRNGVHEPDGDLLFKYPLTACDSKRERQPGYLVYKFVLQYDPTSERFPNKDDALTVNIECRYPSNYHMHQLAIQPTWETPVVYKRLKPSQTNFQIQLMDDTWQNPAQSWIFQLGETVNFQVSALHLSPGQKLYISSCYATPVTHPKSHIKFTLIDNYGCLLDSKTDPGASKFISRTDDRVRFSMKAFQFITDPDAEISMHCQLDVTTAGPNYAHKLCTYVHNGAQRWEALSGDDAICECCDSRCVPSKRHQAKMNDNISHGSLWVSSHSEPSNGRGNPSGVPKIHDTDQAKNTKPVHPGAIETVKHKETPGVTDVKSVKEELQWLTYEDEKVNVFESEGDIFNLKQQNYTTERSEHQRWNPEAAERLDTNGEKNSQTPADGNMKPEKKEVFEQENSGDDELDGKKTWYFAWR